MKNWLSALFSQQLMMLIMGIFFVSIALATFVENELGYTAARAWVYNALWFFVLLLIGVINLIGIIIQRKLYRKEKLSLFAFHCAFVLILSGALRYSLLRI